MVVVVVRSTGCSTAAAGSTGPTAAGCPGWPALLEPGLLQAGTRPGGWPGWLRGQSSGSHRPAAWFGSLEVARD